MKKWTSHQALDGNLFEAGQVNAELRDHQSSMTTLDRTQLPASSFGASNLAPYALHRMYVVPLTPAAPPAEAGEQPIVDTFTPAEQFQCATAQTYGGGWRTTYTGALTGFRGGNLFIEFQGCTYVNPFYHQTSSNEYPPNPKFFAVRIIVGGVVIAESMGSGAGGCTGFRLFGTSQLPPGDHEVLVQWRGTAPGKDDPIVEAGSGSFYHLATFHLWSGKCLAIGRWR